ncbi:hypothetical protein [Herpetosiphon giganteus]|nr:hypothetical protein [Herpetosiphon giganteus]MBM7845478.1 hypothetical protein [Herpetosiphon giganteus]
MQEIPSESEASESENVWNILQTLIGSLIMPEDWSENHHQYLYSDPGHTD